MPDKFPQQGGGGWSCLEYMQCISTVACIAGVNGEGEGEQERWRRGTGARDKGMPATKTSIFSFLQPPVAAKF